MTYAEAPTEIFYQIKDVEGDVTGRIKMKLVKDVLKESALPDGKSFSSEVETIVQAFVDDNFSEDRRFKIDFYLGVDKDEFLSFIVAVSIRPDFRLMNLDPLEASRYMKLAKEESL